jgi:hypothetical protein
MPKYTFKCDLGHEIQKYTTTKVKNFPCTDDSCSATMVRQPPRLQKADVHETIDKFFNIQQSPDQSELVQQRRDEYYWTVEVPRLVNSGTYALDTMLELGWITVDDKDQIQINTAPPHKR